MIEPNNVPTPDATDAAIAARLVQLSARPVDLSRLQKRIEAEIPRPKYHTIWQIMAMRSVRAAAAMLLVAVTALAITIASWSGPALASTDDLLQLHQSLVSQRMGMTDVSSMEAANAALTGKWPGAPAMPSMPEHKDMACCVHSLGKAKAACVLLAIDGVPVTMASAESAQVRMPEMQKVERSGVTFHVQTASNISMVMIQRGDHWYCLMGQLPADRLIQFWGTLAK